MSRSAAFYIPNYAVVTTPNITESDNVGPHGRSGVTACSMRCLCTVENALPAKAAARPLELLFALLFALIKLKYRELREY